MYLGNYLARSRIEVQRLRGTGYTVHSYMADDQKVGISQALEEQLLLAYDQHADEIFRHCLARVRDREAATDIVQDAYMRTWDYLAKGKEVEHMRAFLYRVANNLIVDRSRRKKSSSLDAMMEDDGYEPADENVKDPTERQAAREALALLEGLEDMYRAAITMRYLDEMSPREIAEILGVSENVVSVRIHRGLEKLRAIADRLPGA